MYVVRRSLAGLIASLALAACGGGSSDNPGNGSSTGNSGAPPVSGGTSPVNSGPPVTPGGEWLKLTASTNSVSTYESEDATFSIIATSSRTFEKPVNIGVVDKQGLISTDVKLSNNSALEYLAKVRTASGLRPGTHTTYLEVRLCEDAPETCKTPLPGSPWYVPLTVLVRPDTNLGTLSVVPGVAPWSTFQGNASHTGFVPATFSASGFNRRWASVLAPNNSLNAVAVENGKVFVTRGAWFGEWALQAIDESTGQTAWTVNLGTLSRVNAPAAGDGKVYVTSTGHQDTFFWVFDQGTGKLLGKTAMNSQWQAYPAPTVYGGNVYTGGGYYGGLSKFRSDATQEWFGELPQYDGWTPAVDPTYAYAYLGGTLHALWVSDGRPAFTIANPDYSWYGYTGTSVVLGSQMAYVADGGRLIGFDLAGRKLAWSVNNSARSQPALASGNLYVTGALGTTLEARKAADGQLQWVANLAPKTNEVFTNVIVTNSHAFVSSAENTVAIDLATHDVVWKYALGGSLSISERGVLYIASPTGKLAAVNLR